MTKRELVERLNEFPDDGMDVFIEYTTSQSRVLHLNILRPMIVKDKNHAYYNSIVIKTND